MDEEQEKVALQIAPGVQWIRGLAGTGKTVLIAMRAANIHFRFPNTKILFTFNTQSLYKKTQVLISRFYRFQSEDVPPDWNLLHRYRWRIRNEPSRMGYFARNRSSEHTARQPKGQAFDDDPAPVLLEKIVNGADTDNILWNQPEGAGLEAIAEGFRHLGFKDDHEVNATEWIVYDALDAYCQEMVRQGKPKGAFES